MDTLYKFVSSDHAVKAMISGSIKFTKIDELNDPSELVSFMNRDAVRASLREIRKNGYSQHQFQWLGYQEALLRLLSPETRILDQPPTIEQANRTVALPIYDDFDFMERQLLATIAFIRSRVGVLSLTERYDSLPMWAHYGVQANGFVVRFEGLKHHYAAHDTGSLNIVKPIRYVEDIVGMTHDPTTQDNLFFCKFQDWSYEREWRVVNALSNCSISGDKKIYLRQIPPALVNGVIFGWNVADDIIQTLMDEIAQIRIDVEFFRAFLDHGRVKISRVGCR